MGDFGEKERAIRELFSEGTEFNKDGKSYCVSKVGKPTCSKGEPKTDIYIKAENSNDSIEIKISYKKENADFLENKMSAERAEQLFGPDWKYIIEQSTLDISNEFEARILIYANAVGKTEKGAITLGWKFELMNKPSGALSGKMNLTSSQVIDVYAGNNLTGDKKDASVNGETILNSGIANYILMDDTVKNAQDVIDRMIPIEEYVEIHPDIYFACKALNYRTFKAKWDGDRPLCVQVIWDAQDGKLVPKLKYDEPLIIRGNEVAQRLIKYMQALNIRNTDDLNDDNTGTDKIE